jgi:large subunit ribosomal protein L18
VSNKYIYASLIDDATGSTLFSLSTSFNKTDIGCTVPAARELGLACANKAQSLGINSIVFDRSGYAYHGRVKALAEGAREGSLVF